ncbi:MAG: DNA sulfur modification protein DndB [Bacilli bacterium]|nr:DNA sulfur modification protein DndB [Candidatus Paceibacterota bacterium]MDD4411977.1 DNA sulfur modification protein DndB [Bacilli bacterium]
MLKDKEQQLKLKLKNIIHEFGYDNTTKQGVMNEFKSRNLDSLRPAWVFSENLDLETLSDVEDDVRFLFLFSLALNKTLKEKNIEILSDYKSYFTNVEINNWENYSEEKEDENIFPLIFKNTTEIFPGYYQTSATAQYIEKLNKANMLIYNPNAQRGMKVTKKKIGISIDSKKVEQIENRILEGEQFPDDLKFNILKNGEEKFNYNPKTKILTIFEGSILNILDGAHRNAANALALSKNPDLQFIWPIKISNFTEIKAHNFMVQIDRQTPIPKDVISIKDYSKNENLVLDKIMDSHGDLANVTKDTDAFVKSDRGLVSKPILAEAIKDNYDDQLDSAMNRDSIANWIVEFTNYLMGVYSDEFIVNPYEIKKTSYINNLNMFYGYIALSAILKDNKDWKKVLKQKIDSIDFSIDNPMWRDLGIIKENKIGKPTKNKLYKLFMEV